MSNLFLLSWIGLDGSFFSLFLFVLFCSSMLNFANSLVSIYIYLEVLRYLCISKLLAERTYTAPSKWMRGKGRVTIQFGCCYNYATVSFSCHMVYQSWFMVGFSYLLCSGGIGIIIESRIINDKSAKKFSIPVTG